MLVYHRPLSGPGRSSQNAKGAKLHTSLRDGSNAGDVAQCISRESVAEFDANNSTLFVVITLGYSSLEMSP